jgi:hypothetical protein
LGLACRRALSENAQSEEWELAETNARRGLAGEQPYSVRVFELVDSIVDQDRLRTRRIFEQHHRRLGPTDLWAVSHIVAVEAYDVLKPGISTGITWFTSQRTLSYRLKGEPWMWRTFPDTYGFVPCTQMLRERLLEGCRDFREALGAGTLRQVERPEAE